MKLKHNMRFVAIFVALCLLSVAISGCANISSPSYEFSTGQNNPPAVSNLLKNGPVVLYFVQNNCPDCAKMDPKIAAIEANFSTMGASSSNVTNASATKRNVTFITINLDDNNAPLGTQNEMLFQLYGVQQTPTTVIIRSDGAVAKLVGDVDAAQTLGPFTLSPENPGAPTLVSAIQAAQAWK